MHQRNLGQSPTLGNSEQSRDAPLYPLTEASTTLLGRIRTSPRTAANLATRANVQGRQEYCQSRGVADKKQKTKCESDYEPAQLLAVSAAWQPSYMCTTIAPKSQRRHEFLLTCRISSPVSPVNLETSGLVDTGALDRNYVSREIANLLVAAGGRLKPCEVETVCSCSSNVCI